jgi:DNA repair photolyase
MGEIISASRRSDIPAFFWPRFLETIERGYVSVPNPITGKPYTLSLKPEDVDCLVFWTKNPSPSLPSVREIQERGYDFVYHVTVNGYGDKLEGKVPPWWEVVKSMKKLSKAIGRERVFWRFDPVLPHVDNEITLERFKEISRALSGYVSRCYVAIFHPYRKALARLRRNGYNLDEEFSPGNLPAMLLEEGRRKSLTMFSCCSPLLEVKEFQKGSCVDGEYLSGLFNKAGLLKRNHPTRPGCGCTQSRDIGHYRSCTHGCLYCYAS